MKVLILATDIFSRSGIARYTSTLANSLGRTVGAENVEVLCFFSWGSPSSGTREYRLTGMVSDRPRAGVWSMMRFLIEAFGAGFRGYDLVIANHIALAPVAAVLNLLFGTPYWVACHSVEIWWGTSYVRLAALRRAQLVLPVSRYTAEVVKQIKGVRAPRVRVLYNAVPDFFEGCRKGRRNGPPRVLSVCNLVRGNEFKGVDTVIKALPDILKSFPEVRYTVVGHGELRADLERLASALRVESNVDFLGEISDEELIEQYLDCDVFVLPSRRQRQGRAGGEGFGRVYVEAALAGKPVVGSQVGGAAEAVVDGETGLLVNPYSVASVSRAIVKIVQSRDLGGQMGANGRSRALETFSDTALCRSLGELLRPYGLADSVVPRLAREGGP